MKRLSFALRLFAGLFAASSLFAADLYWNPSGSMSTTAGGSGNWTESGQAAWWDGASADKATWAGSAGFASYANLYFGGGSQAAETFYTVNLEEATYTSENTAQNSGGNQTISLNFQGNYLLQSARLDGSSTISSLGSYGLMTISVSAGKTLKLEAGQDVLSLSFVTGATSSGNPTFLINGGGAVEIGSGVTFNPTSQNARIAIGDSSSRATVTFGDNSTFIAANDNGRIAVQNGTLNINGGNLTAGTLNTNNNTLHAFIIGGVTTTPDVTINLNGGTLNAVASNTTNKSDVKGLGTGIAFAPLKTAASTQPGGTLNLNGGTLITSNFYANANLLAGAGSYNRAVVNFNGTRVVVSSATSANDQADARQQRLDAFISGFSNTAANGLNILSGGAIFDTSEIDAVNTSGIATILSPLSGSGPLHKLGANTLCLDATNTYTGDTLIEGGTLLVSGVNTASTTYIDAGASLMISGEVGDVQAATGSTIVFLDGGVAGNITCEDNVTLLFDLSDMQSLDGAFASIQSLRKAPGASMLNVHIAGATPSAINNWQLFSVSGQNDYSSGDMNVVGTGGLSWTSDSGGIILVGPGSTPTVSITPLRAETIEGGSAIFTAETNASTGYTCQWYHGSTVIPSATSLTLTIDNVRFADAGEYYLRVTDPATGSSTAVATLSVQANPMWTLRMPYVFARGMVLQRDKDGVPVWGYAKPGDPVSVSFAGQSKQATADEDGNWIVYLDSMPASASPRSMSIQSGDKSLQIDDILVGDLWVCGGQSNMEWRVSVSNNAAAEMADAANYPLIRRYKVTKERQSWTPTPMNTGTWYTCSPSTVGDFTAVGYFFARELQRRELAGVPIALIDSCDGGTPVEAWMSREVLESDPDMNEVFQYSIDRGEGYNNSIKAPTVLYNSMIVPLLPMAVKGFIWYQGEENAERYEQYRKLFPAMIRNWREDFTAGDDAHFYFVQLANCRRSTDTTNLLWANMRESQMVGLTLPNTGVAVTIDIGNDADIHPTNKQDVGLRLALNALAKAYEVEDLEYSGPVFDRVEREGSSLRVFFHHAEGLRWDNSMIKDAPHFEIAGADGVFHAAQASIDTATDTVLVSAAAVPEPMNVRYAWHNTPSVPLYNGSNLPASPFRSGTWYYSSRQIAGSPTRAVARNYVAVESTGAPLPNGNYAGLYNPAILAMPGGRLVAAYTFGGDRAAMGLPLFRIKTSDDGGLTWTLRHENYTTRVGQARLIYANGIVYLMGQGGNINIIKSVDNGVTWSNPVNLTTGESWQTTPANIWRAKGNIYAAFELVVKPTEIESWSPGDHAPVLWRAAETADLTNPASWTRSSILKFTNIIPGYRDNTMPTLNDTGVPFFTQNFPTRNTLVSGRAFHPMGWLEANVVQFTDPSHPWHDPDGNTFHMFMRANTGGTGYGALAKVVENSDNTMTTMLETAPSGQPLLFTPVPGGQMKFHVLYDEQTQLYWFLGSQATDSMTRAERLPNNRYNLPNEERHRLTLHYSKDMIHWKFAAVVAIGDSAIESRHYASMDFDGDDLIVLSRSGDADSTDAHNGNLITFHRVKNFRDLVY